jgi:hypothetical protein
MAKLIKLVTSNPSSPTNLFHRDSDTSSEGLVYDFEGELGWDTDDEVEEANAADDVMKIIEGDW